MPDHVSAWLGAYHDGELRGARLRQVEQHLAGCAACQVELAEVRRLSDLLQEPALHTDFLPAGRFVTDLNLRLPRRSEPPKPRRLAAIGWWLIPVAVLGAWLIVDITLSLSGLVRLALETGLLGEAAGWLQGYPPQAEWFAAIMELFGGWLSAPALEALSALHEVSLFAGQAARSLLPQALLGSAYLGWLLAWWLRQQPSQNQD